MALIRLVTFVMSNSVSNLIFELKCILNRFLATLHKISYLAPLWGGAKKRKMEGGKNRPLGQNIYPCYNGSFNFCQFGRLETGIFHAGQKLKKERRSHVYIKKLKLRKDHTVLKPI